MKRTAVLLVVFLSTAAMAQSQSVGLSIGISDQIEDGFDIDFNDSSREAWYMTELDNLTALKIKIGQVDTDHLNAPDPLSSTGEIDYVNALIEYKVDEVFGSTGIFAGPGFYRLSRNGIEDETDYGFSAGVNGYFPVTRRFAFIAELSYHWANFEQKTSFGNISGGLKMKF